MTEREHFIEDIAETALYGGIGYWAVAEQVGEYGARYRCRISEFDESTGKPEGKSDNLLLAIQRGIEKARDPEVQVNPQIRSSIVTSDIANDGGGIDADCADVVVQLGMFGRIVYG